MTRSSDRLRCKAHTHCDPPLQKKNLRRKEGGEKKIENNNPSRAWFWTLLSPATEACEEANRSTLDRKFVTSFVSLPSFIFLVVKSSLSRLLWSTKPSGA